MRIAVVTIATFIGMALASPIEVDKSGELFPFNVRWL
jgi:hypothetical protein